MVTQYIKQAILFVKDFNTVGHKILEILIGEVSQGGGRKALIEGRRKLPFGRLMASNHFIGYFFRLRTFPFVRSNQKLN